MVSIIIPSYNRSSLILETIHSVLNQSYKDIEVIVVDNGSTDDSVQVIQNEFGENDFVRLIALDSNSGGPARPRNVGIDASKGEYVAFLDSDDLWEHNKLNIQMSVMTKYKVDFVSTDALSFSDSGEIDNFNKYVDVSDVELEFVDFRSLLFNNNISCSSVVLRRDILIGRRFNCTKKYISIEDHDLWLRLHETIEKSAFVKLPLLFYRNSSDCLTEGAVKKVLRRLFLYIDYRTMDDRKLRSRYKLYAEYIYHILSRGMNYACRKYCLLAEIRNK